MTEYEISVPLMGVARLTVIADTPEDAMAEALDIASHNDVDEWYALPIVMEGNIFHGPLNRARIDGEYPIDE